MGTSEAAIMLRAKISEAEWSDIRKRAIDANMSSGEYVALLLREGMRAIDGYSRKVRSK